MTNSEQARADAMADAEFLTKLKRRNCRLWARRYGTQAEMWARMKRMSERDAEQAVSAAIQAARAAFRAVPGLRGE